MRVEDRGIAGDDPMNSGCSHFLSHASKEEDEEGEEEEELGD